MSVDISTPVKQQSQRTIHVALQEDSQEVHRISTAGIYMLPFDTHRLGPKPSMLQMSQISRSGNDPFEMVSSAACQDCIVACLRALCASSSMTLWCGLLMTASESVE